ncbi:glutamate--cysteine ligase [Nicoliella lavandulae]|uniref:Glutamate--cysteine ligase n=1 Tax=Nicoliella lavandulae TaxID=3082954 RepID=A0ABU8SLP4_9LACO
MLNQLGVSLNSRHLIDAFLNVSMGIEIERMRTDYDGKMSMTPHPTGAGSPFKNPWITKDYLESMTEVVTPIDDVSHTLKYDYELTNVLRQALRKDELLWPLSMPAELPKHKDKSLLAVEPPEKQRYFESICERYGITRGAPCGVHINLSVSEAGLNELLKTSDSAFTDIKTLRNHAYSMIARGFIKYRWLLTYLFGASPVAQANYFDQGKGPNNPIRSIRQSHFGFITSFDVDYSDVNRYADRILEALKNGEIAGTAEFHGSVRFRGNNNLELLKQNGARYLELRMFDLDPRVDVAVQNTTLQLVSLLVNYFLFSDVEPFADDAVAELRTADAMNERVALERPDQVCEYQDQARQLIHRLRDFVNYLALGPEYIELLNLINQAIDDPNLTINGFLNHKIKNGTLLDYGLSQANQFQQDALMNPHHFNGFKKNEGHLSAEELKRELNAFKW